MPKKAEQIKKQIEAVGKGFGKLGFNYHCEKCNEYFRWAKLVPEIQEGPVPMHFMCCPNCGEMVVDIKRDGGSKYAKKSKAKVKKRG